MQFIKSSLQMSKTLDTRVDIRRRNVLTKLHFGRCRFQLETMYLKFFANLWDTQVRTVKTGWRWKGVEEFGTVRKRELKSSEAGRKSCAGRKSREWLTMTTISLPYSSLLSLLHSKNTVNEAMRHSTTMVQKQLYSIDSGVTVHSQHTTAQGARQASSSTHDESLRTDLPFATRSNEMHCLSVLNR